jgi:hypothetical protein
MSAGTPASIERLTGKPLIREFTCTAGSANAFYKGDLVQLDASGTLAIGATTAWLGIAGKAHDGTATTKIPVDIIVPDGSTFKVKHGGTSATTELGHYMVGTFTAGAHTFAAGAGDFVCISLIGAAASGGFIEVMPVHSSCQGVVGIA